MNNISRQGFLSSIPVVTKNILIINVIVFFFDQFMRSQHIGITDYLALYNFKSQYFYPFQIITHMFMHANFAHIFFNMFGVFMFGRIIEMRIGSRKFLILYMSAGIGAALLQLTITNFQLQHLQNEMISFAGSPSPAALQAIIHKYNSGLTAQAQTIIQAWTEQPANYGYLEEVKTVLKSLLTDLTDNPMVGASGAVFGVLIAFAMLFPDVELMLLFFPVPIKAKYLIPGYAVLELFLGVAQFRGDNIAHYAHLGGAIVGFFMIRYWKKNQFTIY